MRLVTVLPCIAAVLSCAWAEDVMCKKRTKTSVQVGDGESFSFKTQAGGEYKPNSRCIVKYKKSSSCPSMRFLCSKFSLKARNPSCTKGDKMLVVMDGKAKRFCQGNPPNVTTSGDMKIVFISNRASQSSGAECSVECVNGQDGTPGNTGMPPTKICCTTKTVGGIVYTLVTEKDTSSFDCHQNCVYEENGKPGPRVCFKHGDLAVVCGTGTGTGPLTGTGTGPLTIRDFETTSLKHRIFTILMDFTQTCFGDTGFKQVAYFAIIPKSEKEILQMIHNRFSPKVGVGRCSEYAAKKEEGGMHTEKILIPKMLKYKKDNHPKEAVNYYLFTFNSPCAHDPNSCQEYIMTTALDTAPRLKGVWSVGFYQWFKYGNQKMKCTDAMKDWCSNLAIRRKIHTSLTAEKLTFVWYFANSYTSEQTKRN